jgi:hypothetical protein
LGFHFLDLRMRQIGVWRFVLVWLMLMAFACGNSSKPEISFYFWRTAFNLSDAERDAIKHNEVRRIYVRYFDVDTDADGPFPRASIRFLHSADANIIPVVFIKNQVFLKNPDVEDLAERVLALIADIDKSSRITTHEIQFDCDWTAKTRASFFRFLEVVKSRSGKKLSATIRLHQIKYASKTGIPPVDRGVLMYYNMSAIESGGKNSIYDRKTAKRYLGGIADYPQKLDVALPIYSWAIHVRNNRPIGLRRKEDLSGIDRNSVFKVRRNQYLVTENQYFHGTFYKKDDVLKIESVSTAQIEEMAYDLREAGLNPSEIIFYDLDEFNLNRYEKDIFSETARGF